MALEKRLASSVVDSQFVYFHNGFLAVLTNCLFRNSDRFFKQFFVPTEGELVHRVDLAQVTQNEE